MEEKVKNKYSLDGFMPRSGETGAIWPFTAIGEMDRVAADRICIVVTHDPRVMEQCSQYLSAITG